ncbi:hypothetical protein [Nannocystis pusilla]|uniref:hypothetical protein n=1 Tax=Nannocystis pusilla TaxID=889268 RepID=UPI003DA1D7AC
MELSGEFPDLGIALLGVNGIGFESGIPQMTSGRFIPLLQNVAEVDAWTQWEVVYRNVIILDRDGAPVGVFNLTEHDLSMMGEYEALKGMLLDVAMM